MRKKMWARGAALAASIGFGTVHGHHGSAFFFDTSKVVTLEGQIVGVEWVNPHRRLYLESPNEEGELETWVLWGSSNFAGPGAAELKERLQPGISIVARAFPSRHSERREGARETPYPNGPLHVEAGEIRFPNGDVAKFGSGPTF